MVDTRTTSAGSSGSSGSNTQATFTKADFGISPYEGLILPSTERGRKLIQQATRERSSDDKLSTSGEKADYCFSQLRRDAGTYGWGSLVNAVQSNAANDVVNLFESIDKATLEMLRRQAGATWLNKPIDFTATAPILSESVVDESYDPASDEAARKVFQKRVMSGIIADRILNSLDTKSKEQLENHSMEYEIDCGHEGVKLDGPIMLFLVLRKLKPNVKVGVDIYKTNVEKATASDHGNDVKLLISYIMKNLNKIVKKDKNYKINEFPRRVFQALETVENKEFNDTLMAEKRQWRKVDAKDYDIDELLTTMESSYDNIEAEGGWKTTKAKDSKLIALATRVEELEKELTTAKSVNNSGTNSGPNSNRGKQDNQNWEIDEWRKKKTLGNETTKDGKKYYWCPHHKNPNKGYPDGLYVTHTLENCRIAKKRRAKTDKEKSAATPASSSTSDQTLTMSDNLKAVLMTRCCLTAAEAESIWKESSGN